MCICPCSRYIAHGLEWYLDWRKPARRWLPFTRSSSIWAGSLAQRFGSVLCVRFGSSSIFLILNRMCITVSFVMVTWAGRHRRIYQSVHVSKGEEECTYSWATTLLMLNSLLVGGNGAWISALLPHSDDASADESSSSRDAYLYPDEINMWVSNFLHHYNFFAASKIEDYISSDQRQTRCQTYLTIGRWSGGCADEEARVNLGRK